MGLRSNCFDYQSAENSNELMDFADYEPGFRGSLLLMENK